MALRKHHVVAAGGSWQHLGAGTVSVPPDPHHRAVRRRRTDRLQCTAGQPAAERGLGPAGACREPPRRRRCSSHRVRREGAAGWLHAARRQSGAVDRRAAYPQQPGLRPDEGPAADRAGDHDHECRRRAPTGAGTLGEGTGRTGAEEPGQTQLRFVGGGHGGPPDDGTVQLDDRVEDGACALQGRRAGAGRPARWPYRCDDHVDPECT